MHDKFTADMCERTVINKACKPIINSSSDKSIIAQYAEKSDLDLLEAETEEKIQITQTEQIDFDEPETVEVEVVSPQKQERKVVEPPVYDPEPEQRPRRSVLKIDVLASGSKGNMYALASSQSDVVARMWHQAERSREKHNNIQGCLVTHEHNDHARYTLQMTRQYCIDIYCLARYRRKHQGKPQGTCRKAQKNIYARNV